MSMTRTLCAWAVPAFIDELPVDHTWVTGYDNRKQTYPDIAAVIAAEQTIGTAGATFTRKAERRETPADFSDHRTATSESAVA